MKTQIWTALVFAPLICGSPVMAGDPPAGLDWQERRLLSPTAGQLQAEDLGRVSIYDGIDERLVDLALDTQFERVQSMMFVGIRHVEPDGGEWADDDCD